MPISTTYSYLTTRDGVITRALRIVGAISQGETPSATAISEASTTLNEIMKEWQTDGMQLWKRDTLTLGTLTAGEQISICITGGANITAQPPTKILQAWYRNTTTLVDTPLRIITKEEYNRLSPKLTQSIPNQIYYEPPGSNDGGVASGNPFGIVYVFPAMSSTFVANNGIYIDGIFPFPNFASSTDNPDVPPYAVNALVWALADQLAYEYGVGLAERSMISKKAQTHKAIALSFDQEEGSMFVVPEPRWDNA